MRQYHITKNGHDFRVWSSSLEEAEESVDQFNNYFTIQEYDTEEEDDE